VLGLMFRVSIFGESHGHGIGVLIEGCPPGIKVNEEIINNELKKRRPGSLYTSPRREEDKAKILSGVFNDYTTGAPIVIFIPNRDVDSSFYEKIRNIPRPGHADYTARIKYFGFNDYRGGGIFSGRITAGLVAAGAVAKAFLSKFNIEIYSYVVKIGPIEASIDFSSGEDLRKAIDESPVKCPDSRASKAMEEYISRVIETGDSIGGIVETIVYNVPPGLGEPPIDTLDGDLAKALFAIPGVKGVEFGAGFKLATMHGSEANDEWTISKGKIVTKTNNAGGINGGISNGMPIVFRVVFKPTPTIRKPQKSIDLITGKPVAIKGEGRHDPCIAIRGAPVVEAVTSIVLSDHILRWLAWKNLH